MHWQIQMEIYVQFMCNHAYISQLCSVGGLKKKWHPSRNKHFKYPDLDFQISMFIKRNQYLMAMVGSKVEAEKVLDDLGSPVAQESKEMLKKLMDTHKKTQKLACRDPRWPKLDHSEHQSRQQIITHQIKQGDTSAYRGK